MSVLEFSGRLTLASGCVYVCAMSTVVEIKSAIDHLSPQERAELESMVWPEWDRPHPAEINPPGLEEKLAEAAAGRFQPGNRANIEKIFASLE